MGAGKIKIAISGFGPIGRAIALVALQHSDIELVAVNDIRYSADYMVCLWDYDFAYDQGKKLELKVKDENTLTFYGTDIAVYYCGSPEDIPWFEVGAEYVVETLECSTDERRAAGHLRGFAKKVVIAAPSKYAPTFVVGVNEESYKSDTTVVSTACCVTNCFAPLAKVINEKFGIVSGLMTTILPLPEPKKTVDGASQLSVIRKRTEAALAVGKIIPALDGKIKGNTFELPNQNLSFLDLTVELKESVTYEEIKSAIKVQSEGKLKGILGYTESHVRTSELIGDNHSSIFDAKAGIASSARLVQLLMWFDDKSGYSSRVIDLIKRMSIIDSFTGPSTPGYNLRTVFSKNGREAHEAGQELNEISQDIISLCNRKFSI